MPMPHTHGADLTGAGERHRLAPDRHERVLHGFLHDRPVSTATAEPQQQPRRMTGVQLVEGATVAVANGDEQRFVG